MKHLIETTDLSSLGNAKYDRLILDSAKNEIIYRGGVINANGHPYVDLGLPSGLKWATMNVGAKTEEDYGHYYMWGSITPNTPDECDWANAPFNNGASFDNSGYFNSIKDTVCPNDVLAKEYDAASHIMGGDWRMPTKADFQELYNNTTQSWVTINGVNGRKFTSKTDTSKYIFIPVAGYYHRGSVNNVGNRGHVWSSSLHTSNSGIAWHLYLDSVRCSMDKNYRYDGRSVRGVL